MVLVAVKVDDLAKAKTAQDPGLKQAMKKGGVAMVFLMEPSNRISPEIPNK